MDAGLIVLGALAIIAIIIAARQFQRADGANQRATRLLSEVSDLREKMESLREELSSAKHAKERLNSSVTKVKKKNRGEEKRFNVLTQERNNLKSQVESLEASLAQNKEVRQELRERMEALEIALAQAGGMRVSSPAPVTKAPAVTAPVEEGDDALEGDVVVDGAAPSDEPAPIPDNREALIRRIDKSERNAEGLERKLARMEERLSRAETVAKVSNDRFRETLRNYEDAAGKLRRSLRQEADHREMVRVLKDRLESAQELLLNLEVQFGAKVPDEMTGELKRRHLKEALDAEEAAKSRRSRGKKPPPAADPKPVSEAPEVAPPAAAPEVALPAADPKPVSEAPEVAPPAAAPEVAPPAAAPEADKPVAKAPVAPAEAPAPGGDVPAPESAAPVPGGDVPAPGGSSPAPGGSVPAPGGASGGAPGGAGGGAPGAAGGGS